MRLLLVFGLAALCCHAGDLSTVDNAPHRSWRFSVSFYVGTQTLDAFSSRGQYELNPILGRGQFGAEQIARKGLIDVALIAGEWLLIRRHSALERPFTVFNYAAGAASAAVAVRNFQHR